MSTGAQLKKLRLAAGLTVEAAAQARGVSKRLWEYWEKNEKLPPAERDAITRERLLAWAQTSLRPLGKPNVPDEPQARSKLST